MAELQTFLDSLSPQSRTSKLWVNNLIKPVPYMMLFMRAEREGDWSLHLHVVSKMIPYFFTAGHHNYARYGLYYLNDMKNLPASILEKFLKEEHVTRHQKGFWNGIWTDMFIETTFMRYGKGPGGLIGLTLKPNVVKNWAYNLQTSTQILQNLEKMRKKSENKEKLVHKEEGTGRIKADSTDRENLRTKLEMTIHPLHPEQHNRELVNIASGKISKDVDINVDDALQIGTQQMKQFERDFPSGFHTTS